MSGCLLCGCARSVDVATQTDRLYGTTRRQFKVVRCAECGLARLDPMPAPEELGRFYPSGY